MLSYLSRSSFDATMWHKVVAAPIDDPEDVALAELEGCKFRSAYDKGLQFIMARTNHHVHLPTKKGRVPLFVCRAKGKKKTPECKHLFPKAEIRRATVVCKG